MVTILGEECFARLQNETIMKGNKPHPLLVELRCLCKVQSDIAGRIGFSPKDRAEMKEALANGALDLASLRADADKQELKIGGPRRFRKQILEAASPDEETVGE